MRVFKTTLPREMTEAEIYVLADVHMGDENCDISVAHEIIDRVEKTPNAYMIVNGDIVNWASVTSVSDTYTETMKPMEEIQGYVNLLSPVKDKILLMTSGNHENRLWRNEGIDLSALVAKQLGIKNYTRDSGILFVKIGHSRLEHTTREIGYTIYVSHGSGGGRKEGAKAIRLADMASVVDADVYIHSHTHLPMIMREKFYRVAQNASAVNEIDRLFVNTASALDYGGYGERAGMKPSSKRTPIIYLSGRKHHAEARL